MDYKKRSHSVYSLTYHLVFVTKYRKPVISEEIADFMKKHAAYLCERFDGSLLAAETDTDHIHLLVSLPPQVSPADLIRTLKTQLSKEVHLNKEYDSYVKKHLYGDVPLWSPSYFICTTGGCSIEKVKEYIESQRTDEHKRKYVKSGKYRKKNTPV